MFRFRVMGFSLVLLLAIAATDAKFRLPTPWQWQCRARNHGEEPVCIREAKGIFISDNALSLNHCKLTCGQYGSLWPRPSNATLGKEVNNFYPENFTYSINIIQPLTSAQGAKILMEGAISLFQNQLKVYQETYFNQSCDNQNFTDARITRNALHLDVNIETLEDRLSLTTNESYTLDVTTENGITKAVITAVTFFGARHGVETLLQLITYNEDDKSLLIVSSAQIHDSPAFPYRGILLDTSRNFFTVKDIERTLDTMAANKLNTFHWHISDSASFPLNIKSLQKMIYYGAYSCDKVYEPEDVRHLVEYGRVRGIRVLPELDAPSHVANGWQWGPEEGLGELLSCYNGEPWTEFCKAPPCGQLNIANQNIYKVLGSIYNTLADLYGPLDLFHYGGDEVIIKCWNTTQEIIDWMRSKGSDLSTEAYYDEWGVFQEKARNLLTDANGGKEVAGILWTSELTAKERIEKHLDKTKYIIQMWFTSNDTEHIGGLLEKGYKVIFSNKNAWYLDCGFGAWVGEGNNGCSPYKEWQLIYDNDPYGIALNATNNPAHFQQILGGEAALWSESVDAAQLDSKMWPRGAALAERLWTNPEQSWRAAEHRMIHHRQRLFERGVQAERLQPEWCHQNSGLCYRHERRN